MEISHINHWQRLTVYQTVTQLIVVASDVSQTQYRLIKISRTSALAELSLFVDSYIYSRSEMNDLLGRVTQAANVSSQASHDSSESLFSRSKASKDIKTIQAYGIVGFVRFFLGYYIILITKASPVAQLGQHIIYKVEDTTMLYIPCNQNNAQAKKLWQSEESRYVKYFETFDLANNFFFCYTYDLTRTMQYNLHRVTPYSPYSAEYVHYIRGRPDQQYAWNWHLTAPFTDWADLPPAGKCSNDDFPLTPVDDLETSQTCCPYPLHPDWFVVLIHGFVGYCQFHVQCQPLHFCLIARRNRHYAGARFFKRGVNPLGYVANDVETEQMIWRGDCSLLLQRSAVSSFVQHRGSIPLFWSQEMTKGIGKPDIEILAQDPFHQAMGFHFGRLHSRYGSPVIVLNLVKQREKRPVESRLTQLYRDAIGYLNQFLPARQRIFYLGYDMARVQKSTNRFVLTTLEPIVRRQIRKIGVFVHRPPLWPLQKDAASADAAAANSLPDSPLLSDAAPNYVHGSYQIQCGVIRTNCVDCLDRTNTAQYVVGKSALAFQLHALGVISKSSLPAGGELDDILEHLYNIHGDTLALQYGGSQLVHNVETYKKTAPFSSHARDIMQTLQRYYSNTFSDWEKQVVMNVYLGIYWSFYKGKNNGQNLPFIRDIVNAVPGADIFTHWLHSWLHSSALRPVYTDWLSTETLLHLPWPKDLCHKAMWVTVHTEKGSKLYEENNEQSWYRHTVQSDMYSRLEDMPAIVPPGWSLPPHALIKGPLPSHEERESIFYHSDSISPLESSIYQPSGTNAPYLTRHRKSQNIVVREPVSSVYRSLRRLSQSSSSITPPPSRSRKMSIVETMSNVFDGINEGKLQTFTPQRRNNAPVRFRKQAPRLMSVSEGSQGGTQTAETFGHSKRSFLTFAEDVPSLRGELTSENASLSSSSLMSVQVERSSLAQMFDTNLYPNVPTELPNDMTKSWLTDDDKWFDSALVLDNLGKELSSRRFVRFDKDSASNMKFSNPPEKDLAKFQGYLDLESKEKLKNAADNSQWMPLDCHLFVKPDSIEQYKKSVQMKFMWESVHVQDADSLYLGYSQVANEVCFF